MSPTARKFRTLGRPGVVASAALVGAVAAAPSAEATPFSIPQGGVNLSGIYGLGGVAVDFNFDGSADLLFEGEYFHGPYGPAGTSLIRVTGILHQEPCTVFGYGGWCDENPVSHVNLLWQYDADFTYANAFTEANRFDRTNSWTNSAYLYLDPVHGAGPSPWLGGACSGGFGGGCAPLPASTLAASSTFPAAVPTSSRSG